MASEVHGNKSSLCRGLDASHCRNSSCLQCTKYTLLRYASTEFRSYLCAIGSNSCLLVNPEYHASRAENAFGVLPISQDPKPPCERNGTDFSTIQLAQELSRCSKNSPGALLSVLLNQLWSTVSMRLKTCIISYIDSTHCKFDPSRDHSVKLFGSVSASRIPASYDRSS